MSGKDVFRKALLFAVDHAQPIASALILAGYIGALVLPFLNKGTFFDENALMVHNSIPGIGYGIVINSERLRKHVSTTRAGPINPGRAPSPPNWQPHV